MSVLSLAARVIAAGLITLPPLAAHADTTTDLQALRDEMRAVRAAYEARLQALEQRLQAAESRAAAGAPASPSPASPVVAPASPLQAAGGASSAAPPAAPVPAAAGRGFMPDLSLILSGTYAHSRRDPDGYTMRSVLLPADAEIGPTGRGLALGESELGLAASIDPWWRGAANIALGDEGAAVEEAYVETTALGRGLTLRAGRFLSNIGYLNNQHAHTQDFVDTPLAYQALLGGAFADDGLRLEWLAPTDQFFRLGLELGRGRGFPGDGGARNGAGSVALTAHTGGDLGDSHSWRAGLSVLQAKADGLALVGEAAAGGPLDSAFAGRTRVWVADAVWKWSPGGNATRTSFKLQGEWLRSRRSGELTVDPSGAAVADGYRADTTGWYVQGVWQFQAGWRVGARTERVDAGTPALGANTGTYALADGAARRNSLMLDWSPSEFSRWRVQFADDRSRPGAADRQWVLQYQMSLGAHGAHGF